MFIGVYGGGNMPHKDYKDYKDSIDTIIGGQVGFEFYDKNINTVGIRTYFDTGHTLGAYWYDKNCISTFKIKVISCLKSKCSHFYSI